MFVNHGRFPSEIAALSEEELILMTAMAEKEIQSRPNIGGT